VPAACLPAAGSDQTRVFQLLRRAVDPEPTGAVTTPRPKRTIALDCKGVGDTCRDSRDPRETGYQSASTQTESRNVVLRVCFIVHLEGRRLLDRLDRGSPRGQLSGENPGRADCESQSYPQGSHRAEPAGGNSTRGDLLRHLRENDCVYVREGARHSWWLNPRYDKRSSVPRHSEIRDRLAKKICRDPGTPFVK